MPKTGIDHTTCPPATVTQAMFSPAEFAFAEFLLRSLNKNKVIVLVKVRVLDVIQLKPVADKQRLFFWRDVLGDKHFDYVICNKDSLKPLIAVELDDPSIRKRASVDEEVKATAARNARFPIARFAAGANLTPALVRQKLIAEYRLATAGAVPEEME